LQKNISFENFINSYELFTTRIWIVIIKHEKLVSV